MNDKNKWSLEVFREACIHSKKMLGCFNPILGQIWRIVGLLNPIYKFNPTTGFVHI